MGSIIAILLVSLLAVAEPEHDPATVQEDMDRYETPLSREYENHVVNVCAEYDLDPAVLFAMMYQESRFNPAVVGDSGKAFGILQVQPRWHGERMARLGVTDLMDEWQEIYVACDYLAEIRVNHPDIREMLTIYRYGDLNVTGEDYAGIVLGYAETIRK